MARAHGKEQILSPSLHILYSLSGDKIVQLGGYQPPQTRLPDDGFHDTLAHHMGSHASSGGFNFGQFRHGLFSRMVFLGILVTNRHVGN